MEKRKDNGTLVLSGEGAAQDWFQNCLATSSHLSFSQSKGRKKLRKMKACLGEAARKLSIATLSLGCSEFDKHHLLSLVFFTGIVGPFEVRCNERQHHAGCQPRVVGNSFWVLW